MEPKESILILGGARSGKSAYAQQLAARRGDRVLYVATATAGDEEMAERIAAHRSSRPAHWRTLEAPTQVGAALARRIDEADVVLLDCMTLWISNLLIEEEGEPVGQIEERVREELEALWAVYVNHNASLILVSNEVGMGLVPPYPLGRRYRDLLGWANQWVARHVDRVLLMVAGLPVEIKGPGREGGLLFSPDE